MSADTKTVQEREQEEVRAKHNLKKVQELKRRFTGEKESSAQKFCKNLRYLMNCLYLKNKKDDDILQMQERVRIATQTNPITVIQTAGPYFFKYREQLARRDMKFFMNNDYRNDVADANNRTGSEVDVDNTPEVVRKMRETWGQYSSPERNVILQKAVEMLGFVAQYTKADKSLKALAAKMRSKK